uniref:AP-4 complex accessory subunit RUSC2-like isoform X1 n=1 Tax=Oncorhynchus gorbuscha TaxID=8017 RepID=UPI001EAF3E93|nr:AP-4 complex accessory subunit RUSC2-like isoform X1 [Oncorhynchus gorbuscha]XP_046172970.1 AP-4 complex accessory subunit RUSC2-like isoform X1 [Oncorhynchus gorbuscha]XP_046172971.1 AP-4 complex accessory subunit RUSC2-like isoform X1 [Oncorhynchus gorbuscha]
MNRTASLSGDTLIACHFPLVQLPPWQLPVQAALCSGSASSAKQPGRLCSSSVGLTRAASLPEQDNLHREPFHSSLRHISSSYWSLKEDRSEEEGDGEGGSDSSGRCDSGSSPEEASQMTISQRHKEHPVVKGSLRSHNSFLPNEGVEEDDEDSDGDNLHRYHEDPFFVLQLHGNSNWALSNAGRRFSKPSSQSASQQNNDNKGSTVLLDYGEQERVVDIEDNMFTCGNESYCFSYGQPKCFPESFSEGHLEYVTDSSCNSSDGVLVNFSSIYNKSNNPATPNDLSCPAVQSSQPVEGSVFLNLHPFSQESQGPQAAGPSQGSRTTSSPHDMGTSAPCWSPQALDSNCNIYLPDGQSLLSSLEISDLTSCLQSQARLPTGTTQKYYKLVTCDLSSQSASPSPALSSTTSVTSEGHYVLFNKARGEQGRGNKQQEEGSDKEGRRAAPLHRPRCMSWDSQHVTSFAEIAHCKRHTDSCQSSSHSHTSQDLCPIQEAVSLGQNSSHSPLLLSPNQGSSTVSNHPSVSPDHEAEEEGACSWATPVVRYSKAQRPSSLPIQPFVLLPPAGKPQSQPLGTLLDQYISHKNTKPSSQPGFKCQGNRLLTHLRPSPLGSYGAILLEGPSSSDTCSTCTPSPEHFQSRRNWTHSSPYRPYSSHGFTFTSPKQAHISTIQSNTELTQVHSCQDQLFADLDQSYPSPGQAHSNQNQSQCKDSSKRSQGMAQIYQDLIRRFPEQQSPRPVLLTHSPDCPIDSHVATMSPSASHTPHPDLLVSFSPDTPLPPHKRTPLTSIPKAGSAASHYSLTAALSSVAHMSSLSTLLQPLVLAGPSEKQHQQQHCDSFSLSDSWPPVEFCLSPEASYESLSISHLQRRGLLKSVSLAVDLIMAHFGTSRDPGEKMWLGTTIGGLVLEHLCPTIQNILQDGLRDHKLDLIIGQRRNHAWNVVEASTHTGPTTRVLHSLLSKVRQCSLLTSHCMKLRAFIMGLLNLRTLEFWLNHLYNQKEVVKDHYHPWGFLAMSQGQCQPLFQELLLLLQPLSMLPFDLNLLLEPRLLHNRQLCSEEQSPPCSTFLMTSCPLLKGDREDRQGAYSSMDGPREKSRPTGEPHQLVQHLQGSSQVSKAMGQEKRVKPAGESSRSLWSAAIPGCWQRQPSHAERGECGQIYKHVIHPAPQQRMEGRREEVTSQEGRREGRGPETPRMTADPQDDSPSQGGLRWAKLFGSGRDHPARTQRAPKNPNGTQTQKRRPSQWLQLDSSQLGLLAHTVWSGKQPDRKHQT